MGENHDIYNDFFGQQYLTDTVTPVVMREEIVMGDCEPRTDADFVELEPVQINMQGSLGRNDLDSPRAEQNIEKEPTGQTVTDMDRSGPTETGTIQTGPTETETGPTEDKNQIDLDEMTNLIENLSSESDESQNENFGVIFHWSDAPHPKVEINKKMYSVTRVSKKGNVSLRCASSHKKVKGLITPL